MAQSPAEPIASLYVHVPFCVRKCAYCAFYSEPSSGELIDRYVGALIRELELVAPDLRPRTIYFGGGTPSLLNLRQWERILQAMQRLDLSEVTEWTVECNPATVSLDKARLLRAGGVNRLSLGVQSFNEALLDRLGRVHTRHMAVESFDALRQAGFDNLNLDLMFAIPGQTLEVWRETLTEATAMGSEHLSTYEVIYEEDTPLHEQLHAGKFDADEDLACAMYEELVERATQRRLPAIRDRQFCPHQHHQLSTIHYQPPLARLPPQRQLLARRLLLRPWPQCHQLRPRRPCQELLKYAALLRTPRTRPTRRRIVRRTAPARSGR